MNHLKNIFFILLLLVGFNPIGACTPTHNPPSEIVSNENQFLGNVVGIKDGDTIVVMHDGVGETIRLYGIDAPEKKQDFGTKSKQFLSDLVFNKTVTVKVKDKDRYGRTIGEVYLQDGTNANHEMVRAGLSWWYEQYAKNDENLKRLQNEARTKKIGLWSLQNPTPPWEFRKRK
jgi:micrococcal nuclease